MTKTAQNRVFGLDRLGWKRKLWRPRFCLEMEGVARCGGLPQTCFSPPWRGPMTATLLDDAAAMAFTNDPLFRSAGSWEQKEVLHVKGRNSPKQTKRHGRPARPTYSYRKTGHGPTGGTTWGPPPEPARLVRNSICENGLELQNGSCPWCCPQARSGGRGGAQRVCSAFVPSSWWLVGGGRTKPWRRHAGLPNPSGRKRLALKRSGEHDRSKRAIFE